MGKPNARPNTPAGPPNSIGRVLGLRAMTSSIVLEYCTAMRGREVRIQHVSPFFFLNVLVIHPAPRSKNTKELIVWR